MLNLVGRICNLNPALTQMLLPSISRRFGSSARCARRVNGTSVGETMALMDLLLRQSYRAGAELDMQRDGCKTPKHANVR
jgi:hypothetical protein